MLTNTDSDMPCSVASRLSLHGSQTSHLYFAMHILVNTQWLVRRQRSAIMAKTFQLVFVLAQLKCLF